MFSGAKAMSPNHPAVLDKAFRVAVDRAKAIFDDKAVEGLQGCEQMPELALCAAGSLLGVYLADESFPVGKVTLLDLFPMSFEEFLEGLGNQRLVELLRSHIFHHPLPQAAHDRLWDLWKRYLIVGGLPEAVALYRA